jgi:hypothetical protein
MIHGLVRWLGGPLAFTICFWAVLLNGTANYTPLNSPIPGFWSGYDLQYDGVWLSNIRPLNPWETFEDCRDPAGQIYNRLGRVCGRGEA